MIARAFPVKRVLVALLLAALAWGMWGENRAAKLQAKLAKAETALQAEKRDRAEKLADGIAQARREDAATIAAQAKAIEENHAKTKTLRADADRLRAATGSLRDEIARVRSAAFAAAAYSDAAARSKATATAAAVFSELLDRCSERREELARYADEARTAGELCVASYEALNTKGPQQ